MSVSRIGVKMGSLYRRGNASTPPLLGWQMLLRVSQRWRGRNQVQPQRPLGVPIANSPVRAYFRHSILDI